GLDAGPSADPSPVKGSAVVHKARSKIPAGRRLVVSLEDEAVGQGVVTLRTGSDDDREGLFVLEGETPVVPTPKASGPPIGEMSAIKFIYGKWAPLSLFGEPAALTSFAPNSGLKAGAGSGAACSRGEIAELSGGAPTLKSRLSSPLSVSMKRGREADTSMGKESPAGKREITTPFSGSDHDGATLTLIKRRRSARGGLSGGVGRDKTEKLHPGGSTRGVTTEAVDVAVVVVVSSAEDAPPPAIAEGVLGDALLPAVPTSAASGALKEATGAHPEEGEGVLAVGEVESRSSDADEAQGEDPAAEPELEALSLETLSSSLAAALLKFGLSGGHFHVFRHPC
ncbi:hypothetical protein PanWU01x14_185960, partial [Parasponia andersonii]